MYWVEAEDGEDLGDYKGYVQDGWDEAVRVAKEVAAGDYGWDGEGRSMVVKELTVTRSMVVKGIEEDE